MKNKLLDYINNPTITNARNSMGCSENWYEPFFAISNTFSLDEIKEMPEDTIEKLVKLAEAISDGLY